MALYNGFSTANGGKKFRLTDFKLVKQDVTNNFNIRRGEKLMNPSFGTIIWDRLFDPMDSDLQNAITNDVYKIIAYDPRVSASNVVVTKYDKGIQIQFDLLYIATGQVSKLELNFSNESNSMTTN